MPVNARTNPLTKVEQDYRLFTWFLTLVVFVMYILALTANSSLRQPLPFLFTTTLVLIHIYLHWQIEKVITTPKIFPAYSLIQGGLAFAICWLVGMEAMPFTLFMALIGESVGMFGLTRRALLASVFFLSLNMLSLNQLVGLATAGWALLGVIPILFLTLVYTILYKRQAEAREQAQNLADELESTNRQLAEYAAQVEDLSIANERQRMARELHDTLSQGLAGLILQLEAADAHLAHNRNDKARSIVGNAMEQARLTLADARCAIDDLRQPALDDLEAALRLEIDRFTNATGIPVRFHSDQTPPLPDPVKETLIRTLAESLTNIAHHAQARNVEVNLKMKDKGFSLTIQDDGQGFDPSAIPSGHYGILGIKERIRLVNGSFEIQSEKGKGTFLIITVPRSPSRSTPVGDG
ncbi:MAG: sensor histidine kinase [Anaerolineales bacterium]|nr:MAG: sensor histidine kinase [Anaerolineales bacterium]